MKYRTLFFLIACGSLLPAATPVILISIDTLRADHLSAYGYKKIQTPGIDGYAQQGTIYTQADAQVPLTLPSHYSMMTSTYPFANGIQENAQQIQPQQIQPGAVTLAGALRGKGYKTSAFISSIFLETETGFDQGFEYFDSPFHYTAFSPLSGSMLFGGATGGPNAGKDRREAPLVTRAALQWLRQNWSREKDQPVFAFLHLYDMHKPYRLESYDAQLTYVDRVLANFRQSLIAMGLWDKAIVIVTSDHGESLGEHGEDSHGYFAYEATLHVPLLIHWPETGRPARVDTPVGLIDLAPTLLDALHLPQPTSFSGKSFLRAGNRPVFAESVHAHDSFGWAPVRTLRQGAWKYIESPKPELYDLSSDPNELRNLYSREPQKAAALREELRRLMAAYRPASAAAKTQQNRALLNSLGYLSAGPAGSVAKGLGADLKDNMKYFRLYEDAIFALAEGRKTEAATKLETLLRSDPGNTLARRDLGSIYLEMKQYERARIELEVAARAAQADYPSQYLLGLTYKYLNRNKEARTQLSIACRLAPEATQCRKQLEELQARP